MFGSLLPDSSRNMVRNIHACNSVRLSLIMMREWEEAAVARGFAVSMVMAVLVIGGCTTDDSRVTDLRRTSLWLTDLRCASCLANRQFDASEATWASFGPAPRRQLAGTVV